MVTAATIPPPGSRWAEIVRVAGDQRRSPPPGRRVPLIGAIVVSAVLHAGAVAVAVRVASQALGGEPEEPIAVELVIEAPPAGAGGGTATAGAEETKAPAPVAASPAASAPEQAPAVESSAADSDVSIADAAAAPQRPEAKPKPPPKAVAAPRRPKKRTDPPATVSPKPEDVDKRDTADAPDSAASAPHSEPAGVAEPGQTAPPATGPAASGGGGGGASSAARSGAGTASGERARILDAYGQALWARIAARKPKGLRLAGRSGVSFTVAADGSLLAARITQPSGNPELDRLALQAVQAAAPMPPPPPALGPQPLSFDIPFTFR